MLCVSSPQAFGVLDKDSSGTIDLSDIMAAYDASKHPEVISGRKSKAEVFRTFLDQFDGGEVDGNVRNLCRAVKRGIFCIFLAIVWRWVFCVGIPMACMCPSRVQVTMDDFERYYATLSASIDDDDYFELVIRNAWHISGGEGATQNTTCRSFPCVPLQLSVSECVWI